MGIRGIQSFQPEARAGSLPAEYIFHSLEVWGAEVGRPVGTLTSSLLIYLAYKAGLDRRTGETAEHLIWFHARSSAATVIH